MRSQIRWVLVGLMLLGPSLLADTREPAIGQAPAGTREPAVGQAPAELDALAKAFRGARSDFAEKADFAPAAVDQWRGALKTFRGQLDAMPRAKWSVTDQVDWYLLLAEMNQADFDLRVLRPWARDPGFYISLVTRGLGDTDKLTAEQAARLTKRLRGAPLLLEKAHNLLTDATRWHAEVA